MVVRANTAIVALIVVCVGVIVDGIVYQLWYIPSVGMSSSLWVGIRDVVAYFTTLPGMLAQIPIILGIGAFLAMALIDHFAD